MSLDGAVIMTRKDMNLRFYGRQVDPMEILGGQVPPPRAASPLYDALNIALTSLWDPHYPHQARHSIEDRKSGSTGSGGSK